MTDSSMPHMCKDLSLNMDQVSKPFLHVPPQKAPWLVFFSHGAEKKTQLFFNIVDRKSFATTMNEISRNTCLAYSHGWLIMSEAGTKYCSLFNPVTMENIKLPPLPHENDFPSKRPVCSLSSAPTDPNCVVLFVSRVWQIALFCRPGEKKWRTKIYKIDDGDNVGLWDLAYCMGKLYGRTLMCRIVVIDFDPDPVFRLLALPKLAPPLMGESEQECLVESCGEIFCVITETVGDTGIVINVSIFKVDQIQEKWERVQSIGDRAFFLCEGRSVSCLASDSGITADSVYYVLPGDSNLYRFDMADKSISMEPFPNLSKPWKTPHWIFL